jgi:ssDNA-binding replication factor A large subunit
MAATKSDGEDAEAEREGAVGRRPRRRVARREGRPQRHVRAAGQQRREEEEAAAEGHKAPRSFAAKGVSFLPSRRFLGGRKQRRSHGAGTAAVSTTLIVVHYW